MKLLNIERNIGEVIMASPKSKSGEFSWPDLRKHWLLYNTRRIFICVHVNSGICFSVFENVCTLLCVCVCVSNCKCAFVNVFVRRHICVCLFLYACVPLYVCMCVYVCMRAVVMRCAEQEGR